MKTNFPEIEAQLVKNLTDVLNTGKIIFLVYVAFIAIIFSKENPWYLEVAWSTVKNMRETLPLSGNLTILKIKQFQEKSSGYPGFILNWK